MGHRILVPEPLAPEGLEILAAEAEILQQLEDLPRAEALIVRSGTRVDADLLGRAPQLKVVARAGAGVDNIDLQAATRRGIVVLNAPTATTAAAAEHTLALIFALARRLPWAHASMQRGEWRRQDFVGSELAGKVLGLVGLGRIGQRVARRAAAVEMRVLAHDPFIAPEVAERLGVQLLPLQEVLARADFVSLHVPLTEGTRGLLGAAELGWMRPAAALVNTARGGLVDEEALLRALDEGRLSAAALDVFAQEPPSHPRLLSHPRLILTPHLAGSTQEAQAEVAREIAHQVLAALRGEPVTHALNLPLARPDRLPQLAPYLRLAEALGRAASQLAQGQWRGLRVAFAGEWAAEDLPALSAAVLKGLLEEVTAEAVNLVNARLLFRERGLELVEERRERAERFSSLLTLELAASGGALEVSGTLLHGEPHVVRLDGYWVEFPPRGHLLIFRHHDRPGMIGQVGTALGQADVNIAYMQVGREAPRGRAIMVLGLDDSVPPSVLEQLRTIPHIYSALHLVLPP